MFRRLLKKTQGTISLFMAVIMLANFSLSAVIVEGARYRMAKEIVQNAADSAAMSVIAKYDLDLYDRYGLFAIDATQEEIQADFVDYFLANLSAELPDEDALGDLFAKLESKYKVSASNTFDMYDFQRNDGNSTVEPVYSIGNPTILQLQMTEFAKYRAVTRMLQDVTDWGSDIQEGAKQQQEDLKIIEDSLDYKEQVGNVSEELAKFTQKLSKFYMGNADNATIDATKSNISIDAKKLRTDLKQTVENLETEVVNLKNDLKTAQDNYDALVSGINNYNKAVGEIIKKENKLRSDVATIQFDSEAEDYDEEAVKKWNEDKKNIDAAVSGLSSYNLSKLASDYNTAKNALSKSDIETKSAEIRSQLNSWKEQLKGYQSEFKEIAGRVKSAINTAEGYKKNVDGKSGDVAKTASDEAKDNIELLKKAVKGDLDTGSYEAVTYLQNTINDIDAMLSLLDTIDSQISSIKFTNIDKDAVIIYNKTDGSKGSVSETSSFKTAPKYTSSSSSSEPTPPDPLANRTEWYRLSKVKSLEVGKPNITPSDILDKILSNTNTLKNKQLRGYHYIYESNVKKASETSGYSKLKNAAGSDFDTEKMKEKYKDKKSVSSKAGDDSAKGESAFEKKSLSNDVYNKLPSKIDESNFDLANKDSEDTNYFSDAKFKNQLDSDTVFSSKGKKAPDSGTSVDTASFSSMKVGGDASDQKESFGKMDSFLDSVQSWFTTGQYDLVTFSYIMCMFNTRMTKSGKFVSIKDGEAKPTSYVENLKSEKSKKWYVDRDPNEDLDLRFRVKALNETKLNAELEYLIIGNQTDEKNANSVWARIYGIRLVNNLVALYTNEEVHTTVQAMAAEIAAAIASVTFGTGSLLAPIIELAIMAILAATETYMDMTALVDEGIKIPLIKTKDNLCIMGNLKNEKGILVSYEDYLMIMLIFTGRNKLLYRSADLIQMNMGDGYELKNKYTYIRCANEVSIKPLMVSYAFVPNDVKNGHTDRKSFRTLIYQGY